MYIDYLIKISNILGDLLFIYTKILQINSMKNGSAGLMITKTSSFRLSAVDLSSGLHSLSYSQAPPVSTPVPVSGRDPAVSIARLLKEGETKDGESEHGLQLPA